jgi:hypothetical protein
MPTLLFWYDPQRDFNILPLTPLKSGKKVVLRGEGYLAPGPAPESFDLYRIPSPLLGWSLTKMKKKARWLSTPVSVAGYGHHPSIDFESKPWGLTPSGFFHAHRWQFEDAFGHSSPVVRTVRVCSLKMLFGAAYPPFASASGEVTIETAVDPSLRIELGVPWNEDPRLTPQEVLAQEISDLAGLTNEEIPSRDQVTETLGDVFPREIPEDLGVDWAPRELVMSEGDSETLGITLSSRSAFAFCFVALDMESDKVVGTSDVAVISSDPSGGLNVFGSERPQTSPPALWKFKHLKMKGVVDPNVDMFVAVLESDPEALEAALEAGADVNITDTQVLTAYEVELADFDPDQWSLPTE